ncbi:hypothetical protein D9O50_08155 [Oxalobacteraceae bacterium CAVE-383]|nr:hypothetical protein D9O50_08155 [Oxalobacteraceae bacterium CAVE-383]
MIATVHSPLVSPKSTARVLRLIPTIHKPLDTNCADVAAKLKRALRKAQSGATAGALVIALDHHGAWSIDLAGQLLHDDDTLCLIACRMLGVCLSAK